jgi:hypothetical protein
MSPEASRRLSLTDQSEGKALAGVNLGPGDVKIVGFRINDEKLRTLIVN